MADNITILRPPGRLDSTTGPAFADDVSKSIAGGSAKLLLDLTALEYISSAGLRTILMAAKQMKAKGGRLMLCSLREQVKDVFEISGLVGVLEIASSHDEAISRLAG